MKKAGGIVALIGGVSGLWVAVILGLISALSGEWTDGARAEATLSVWSALATLFAALTIGAKGKVPGVLLTITALAGPVILVVIYSLHGPVLGEVTTIFFVVFVLLTLIGSAMAVIGAQKQTATPEPASE